MAAFYNEHDPRAAAWLRELIAGAHIAPGVVDERCISEIKPEELHGYSQCHFFAGIGGWSLALRLAGWPDERPVWTGSCPCQPFSGAGKGLAEADPRHLWPVWFPLVRECAPAIVFGEQVASKAALGWLDGVFADLEGAGYACGAADLCAAGVGAPHIRQRLYWVGHAQNLGRNSVLHGNNAIFRSEIAFGAGSVTRGLADAGSVGGRLSDEQRAEMLEAARRGEDGGLEHAASHGREQRRTQSSGRGAFGGCGAGGRGDADQQHRREAAGDTDRPESSHSGAWGDFDLLPCRDGKTRRVESGTFPLAHGVSGRVGLLRGYGNAIVPQVGAEFVRAFLEK